ncbi:MAG: TetR/AcrR family transcriptional regulator [Rickettsiales bacterium]|jgi:AcrR family transcriptional regulator|nr:TetR/AcrR family transcriptional regulator [Rickettsiales bacterium]
MYSRNEHKKPEVRKNEILDAAQGLFLSKGHAKTTIIDILNVYGLLKGVFYYYFESKEEVMNAIIDRMVDAIVAGAKTIAADKNLSAVDKLVAILFLTKDYSIGTNLNAQNMQRHLFK